MIAEPAAIGGPAWGADWDRLALVENGVTLAGIDFGIVRVYHPLAAGVCSCPLGASCGRNTGKHPIGDAWQRQAEHDPERVRTMLGNAGNRSYGIIPPEGTFSWDVDGAAPATLRALAADLGPLPPTRVHRSGSGHHVFYRWPASVPRPAGKNLFGIVTRWAPGGMTVGPGSIHAATGRLYAVERDLPIAELPVSWARAAGIGSASRLPVESDPEDVTAGKRHDWLRDTARHYAGTVRDPDALRAAVLAKNAKLAEPKSEAEVDRAIGDVLRRFPPDAEVLELEAAAPEPSPWPDPPTAAAYHGVLGDIALAVAPYTEADPIGLLGTLLAMFGSACGRGRSFYQGSMQRTNLSVLLVGATGFGGRKGTALDVCRSIFRLAYPDLDTLWLVGVASGEAITGHYARQEDGDEDARVLIVEPEFGRLLTIMNRDGSTLSAVLRNAWDGVPLGHARARDESLVTDHHVTILGHVTPVELRQKLTDTDAANGFANRLLFLAVRRTRLIPFPASPDELVRQYVEPLHRAIVEAGTVAELSFDEDARDRWETFYAELALTPRLGLAGAVTGRHEAQVARLALVYALADRSSVVGVAHLEAAIAFAEYARRSVVWALGDSTGNRHADVLRRMLEDGEVGWKEAKIALGLRTAADLADTVAVLVDAGLAEVVKVPREGPAGRPRQVIRARAKGAKGAKDAGGARTDEGGFVT